MKRKDFGAEPYLYPMPVLVVAAYDKNGEANALLASWAGIIGRKEISLSLSSRHKTVENILYSKEFTISIGTEDTHVSCDYLGLVSGNRIPNKLEKSGFTISKSQKINAPIINELPMVLECRLESYDSEKGRLIAQIINVSVCESVLSDEGKVDISKLRPITFDRFNRDYVGLGKKVGNAYKDGSALR